tara:strand:- start:473 stop:1123 length:651 start_codon:yes stop_codon:yes gene_type:complete
MGRMKEEFMKDLDRIQEKHHPNHLDEDYDVGEFALQMQEQMQEEDCGRRDYATENLHYAKKYEEFINQNQIKMKKVSNVKDAVEVKETKKETLRRLFKANNLVEEDVYKDKRGFVIITRTGIDKIVSKQNIQVIYEPVIMQTDWVVIKAVASMKTGSGETDVRNMMSFGEASDDNLMGGGKKFPVAMAEKRAMSRVVLKIAGFYEQGVFGQDEIVD